MAYSHHPFRAGTGAAYGPGAAALAGGNIPPPTMTQTAMQPISPAQAQAVFAAQRQRLGYPAYGAPGQAGNGLGYGGPSGAGGFGVGAGQAQAGLANPMMLRAPGQPGLGAGAGMGMGPMGSYQSAAAAGTGGGMTPMSSVGNDNAGMGAAGANANGDGPAEAEAEAEGEQIGAAAVSSGRGFGPFGGGPSMYLLAILLPPLAVIMMTGSGQLLMINIILTILGWLPGVFHAWYVVSRGPTAVGANV